MIFIRTFRFAATAVAVSLSAAVTLMAAPSASAADSLAGSWSGGGSVSFMSGKAERARCRASFSKVSATSYVMNATCATASGSVSQSATVRGKGSRFSGGFYNAQYDTSGNVSINVSGRSLSAYIGTTKGSASMRLSR